MKKRLLLVVTLLAMVLNLLPVAFADPAEDANEEKIKILLQPQNYNYNLETQTAVYEVEAEGDDLEFQWYIHNNSDRKTKLSDGDSFRLTDHTIEVYTSSAEERSTIELKIFSSENFGRISQPLNYSLDGAKLFCQISDDHNNIIDTSDAVINLNDDVTIEPPRIRVPVSKDILYFQDLDIECRIEADSEDWQYQWYYSLRANTPLSKYEILEGQTGKELQINSTELQNIGNPFFCYCNVFLDNDDAKNLNTRSSIIPVRVFALDDISSLDFDLDDATATVVTQTSVIHFDFDEITTLVIDLMNENALEVVLSDESDGIDAITKALFDIEITQQPLDCVVKADETVTFECQATNAQEYQWHKVSDDGSDEPIEGANTNTYSFDAEEELLNYRFYCVIKNALSEAETQQVSFRIEDEGDIPTSSGEPVNTPEPTEPFQSDIPETQPMDENRETDEAETHEDDSDNTTAVILIILSILMSVGSAVGAVLVFKKLNG